MVGIGAFRVFMRTILNIEPYLAAANHVVRLGMKIGS